MRQIERLLSKKQVREITGLSYAHTARLEKIGEHPLRVRLTNHPRGRCGYVLSEIAAWVAKRIANRKPPK
jgi:predicted DNA-binding transcriptional regulator AlpA